MRRPTFLVVLPLLAACSGRPPPPATTPPARVVSLAPSITEIVYALGAGDRLVGACAPCDYPAAAARLPRAGGALLPRVEAAVARRPQRRRRHGRGLAADIARARGGARARGDRRRGDGDGGGTARPLRRSGDGAGGARRTGRRLRG